MAWQPNIYSYILWAIATIAGVTAWSAWRRRPKPGSIPLTVLMAGVAWWSLLYGLEMLAVDLPGKLLWVRFQYLGIAVVPGAWLALTLQFTGRGERWLSRPVLACLAVEPVLLWGLVATNHWHGWVWSEVGLRQIGDLWVFRSTYGDAFWVHAAYSYLLMALGLVLLVLEIVRSRGLVRTQGVLLLVGALVPWISNALSILDVVDVPFDLTAFAFTVAGLTSFWALFRYQLLELAPVARDTVIDSMHDAVVAIDTENRIVDVNPAASSLVGQPRSEIIGCLLTDLMPQYGKLFDQYREFVQAHDELYLDLGGRQRWYDMQLSALFDHQRQLRGRLLVLRDISDRKELEAVLEMQVRRVNQLLDVARATIEHPTLELTLQNTLDIAVSLTMADAGSIFLVDERYKVTQSILTRGDTSPLVRESILGQVLDIGLAGWVLRNRRTVVISDTDVDERWVTLPEQPYVAGSAMGVPIIHGGRVLGVLILIHESKEHFDEEHASTLEAATQQMALAIRNTQFYETQRRLADQQATLYNALRALQRPMALQEAISETVGVIAGLTEWSLVALAEIDALGSACIEATAGQLADEEGLLSWLEQDPVRAGLRAAEEIYVPDAQFAPEGLPDDLTCSVLTIPLKKQDDVQRVLFVAVDVPMAFDEDARRLARSLGDVVTLLLRNAQLYESVLIERRRLAALVQSNADGILMVGQEQDILVINQPALDAVGLEGDPDSWIYSPVSDFWQAVRALAPEFAQAGLQQVSRVAQGDAGVGEGEHTAGGRVLHWLNLPVIELDRTVGRLFILHDVTEERVMAQVRDDLTHTMVHDLRNPLTGIYGALSMLAGPLRESLPAGQVSMLDIAHRNTERMLGLVNAILDISRLESGRMPLSPTMFSLSDVVADAVELEQPLSEQKHIQLHGDVETALGPVWADRELIGRVLQNLVGNALKFTPQGGTVRITARLAEQGEQKVLVAISDSGPGIPEDIRSQLFQKFVTGQQEGHGSGLGLAFCRMVLEAHGERIWVDSEPGQGATFTFTLPLAEHVV